MANGASGVDGAVGAPSASTDTTAAAPAGPAGPPAGPLAGPPAGPPADPAAAPAAAPVTRAKEALWSALSSADSREAYWSALTSFLRFETTKSEFESAVLAVLSVNLRLHNAFIRALIQSALCESAPLQLRDGGLHTVDSDAEMPGADHHHAPLPPAASPANAPPAYTTATAPAAAPTLSLKIVQKNSGGFVAAGSDPQSTPEVNPAESAQLNALHDRLTTIARGYGLGAVQPEAASFMQRSLTAQVRRIMVAAVSARGGVGRRGLGSWPPRCATETPPALTIEDVVEAVKVPVMGPWLLPPARRLSPAVFSTSGAIIS